MTDLLFDALSLGVDSVVSGAIVSMIVAVLSMSTQLSNYTAQQRAVADSVNYYRQYSIYDGNTVSTADVISAMVYFRQDLDIYVCYDGSVYACKDGTYYQYNYTGATGEFYVGNRAQLYEFIATVNTFNVISYSDLVNALDSSKSYESHVCEDLKLTVSNRYNGGVITGIIFELR